MPNEDKKAISLNDKVKTNEPTFVIAEMSGNHNHDFDRAVKLLHAAAQSGANAIKLQTYTADTITIDCDEEPFIIKSGPWVGRRLHDLYQEAHMPWEWQPKLKKISDDLGMELFSTPFDPTSVDFLEAEVKPNIYKIASFEVVDLPLLKRVAATMKPVIMSTGMASLSEIAIAIKTLKENGCPEVSLLKCISSYPAAPEQMNLATIPHMAWTFGCSVGLSDHTLSPSVSVAAVALGARIIEKHFTLSRADGGPDAAFSLEPAELKQTISMIRDVERAVGRVFYGPGPGEKENVVFRKSLFAVRDIAQGEVLSLENVRVIRPGTGLAPSNFDLVIGRKAACYIKRGSPLSWHHVKVT